jgi:hypothetical protein
MADEMSATGPWPVPNWLHLVQLAASGPTDVPSRANTRSLRCPYLISSISFWIGLSTYRGRGSEVGRGRPSRAVVYQRLDKALAELNQRYGGLLMQALG